MGSFPIAFLLLVLPAIQCTSVPDPTSDPRGPVDPAALYQELSGDLTGPNGTLKGLDLDDKANNYLSGLIGPNGKLTSLLGGDLGKSIATVLRFFLGPDGVIEMLFGPRGLFKGRSKLLENILNIILSPDGFVARLFGLAGEGQPEERTIGIIVTLLGALATGLFGQNGPLRRVFTDIFGPDGIFRNLFDGIFGPTGILGNIFGGGGGNTNGGNNTGRR